MNPVLFQYQAFTVYTFGFAITVAVLVSAFLLWRRLRRFGYEDESIIDMVLVAGFSALLISRLFYVVQHWGDFSGSFLRMVLVTYFPGLDGVGALLGIIIAVTSFTFIKRWNPLVVLDSVFFSLGLGIFITMLGSFFSGSLPGTVTTSPIAVLYPGLEGLRHPLALYWMLLSIAYFMGVVAADKKYHMKRGLITGCFLTVFGIATLALMPFTQDNPQLFSVPLSVYVALPMIVMGSVLLYLIFKLKVSNYET